jgi:hypothetical protein
MNVHEELLEASRSGDQTKIIELLCMGANPNHPDAQDFLENVLIATIQGGIPNETRRENWCILMRYGASPASTTLAGLSAHSVAIEKGLLDFYCTDEAACECILKNVQGL